MAAASGPSFGVRGASGVESAVEALRDTGPYRIGRLLRARLGAKKSSTGSRCVARTLGL